MSYETLIKKMEIKATTQAKAEAKLLKSSKKRLRVSCYQIRGKGPWLCKLQYKHIPFDWKK